VVDKHPELVAQVEPTLLEQARTVDPDQLAMLARRIVACLDPDGQLASERDHERHREAILTLLPDGSGRLQAQLTGEAAAVWTTVLDSSAAQCQPTTGSRIPGLQDSGGTTRC